MRTRTRLSIAAATVMVVGLLASLLLWQAYIPSEEGSIRVSFCPDCESQLHAEIRKSVDVECAFYDVGSDLAVLLREKNARVVTDDETKPAYGSLIHEEGLMHNKFCILDNLTVLSGSYNPTNAGALNQNALLIIESTLLARNYHAEYKALADQTMRKPIRHRIKINGILVENYFCPRDRCEAHVLDTLADAKKEVRFLTYSFTSDPIGDLLLEKQTQGVSVQGICESQQLSEHSECNKLSALTWEGDGLLHHKTFIIDKAIVIVGSYNPTRNGNEVNRENVLIVHDPALAAAFITEYNRLAEQSSKES